MTEAMHVHPISPLEGEMSVEPTEGGAPDLGACGDTPLCPAGVRRCNRFTGSIARLRRPLLNPLKGEIDPEPSATPSP